MEHVAMMLIAEESAGIPVFPEMFLRMHIVISRYVRMHNNIKVQKLSLIFSVFLIILFVRFYNCFRVGVCCGGK